VAKFVSVGVEHRIDEQMRGGDVRVCLHCFECFCCVIYFVSPRTFVVRGTS
jgi:hypothetical protein